MKKAFEMTTLIIKRLTFFMSAGICLIARQGPGRDRSFSPLPYLLTVFLFISFRGMGLVQESQEGGLLEESSYVQISRPLPSGITSYWLDLSGYEMAYDVRLTEVLSQFFDPGSFFVDVRLEVHPRATRPGVSSAPVVTGGGTQSLPGLPDFANGGFLTDIEYDMLAGDRAFASRFKLARLHVQITADAIYCADELAFMKQLAAVAVKAERERNDIIIVVSEAFPDSQAAKGKAKAVFYTRIILVISSALLIFAVIYISLMLRKRYS